MKAIIIAAGKGSRLGALTENKPKCLLEINGQPILERKLKLLRELGIEDISIVRGYKKEYLDFPQIKYYDNDNFENNNILLSLQHAEEEMNDAFIAIYSDILYTKSVVEQLLENKHDIAVIVDKTWQDYYQGRTAHPIEEAENVIIKDGCIKKIGKHISATDAHGEFIGMVKFSHAGAKIWKKFYNQAKGKYSGKPFQQAKIFEKAYLTDMYQELIDNNIEVNPVLIDKNWWEIDTQQDYAKVVQIFRNFEK